MSLPRTLGELRQSPFSEQRLSTRRVKDEMRDNLIAKLRQGGTIFPGIVGYDDTVVPQIVNAVLSRHNFILLGLRGQAKSRILRALTSLLDDQAPYVAGCEIHDNPTSDLPALPEDIAKRATPHRLPPPEQRYVEARCHHRRPIGDIIPSAARGGHELGSEIRCITDRCARQSWHLRHQRIADLAEKFKGLFNIMQKGMQIGGYPIRLPPMSYWCSAPIQRTTPRAAKSSPR
jgi:magnesium chelatase subunit I